MFNCGRFLRVPISRLSIVFQRQSRILKIARSAQPTGECQSRGLKSIKSGGGAGESQSDRFYSDKSWHGNSAIIGKHVESFDL